MNESEQNEGKGSIGAINVFQLWFTTEKHLWHHMLLSRNDISEKYSYAMLLQQNHQVPNQTSHFRKVT
jgi:hypothetical protein